MDSPLDEVSVLTSSSSSVGPWTLSSNTGSGSFTSNLDLRLAGSVVKLLLFERRLALPKLKPSSMISSPAFPLHPC